MKSINKTSYNLIYSISLISTKKETDASIKRLRNFFLIRILHSQTLGLGVGLAQTGTSMLSSVLQQNFQRTSSVQVTHGLPTNTTLPQSEHSLMNCLWCT